VLSSTRDKGLFDNGNVVDASPFAVVEGKNYRVVWSSLLLIEHIMSNVACAAHFQTLATNVVGKVSELFRLFNTRATQLVLGAGAIHSAARLKSINAKHLALVTQCVKIILSILPHVRAALMAQLPSKQHSLLIDLDNIKKEYADHHDKVLSKFVGIIGGIVEHNLVSRIPNTNFDGRAATLKNADAAEVSCCPFLDGIITNTKKMHQVLVALLPPDDFMDVFSRIYSYLDSKVPKLFIEADLDEKIIFQFPTTIEGKRCIVKEIEILSITLNEMPNVRPWDFGAMKFMERKVDLPQFNDEEEGGFTNDTIESISNKDETLQQQLEKSGPLEIIDDSGKDIVLGEKSEESQTNGNIHSHSQSDVTNEKQVDGSDDLVAINIITPELIDTKNSNKNNIVMEMNVDECHTENTNEDVDIDNIGSPTGASPGEQDIIVDDKPNILGSTQGSHISTTDANDNVTGPNGAELSPCISTN
jgi:vacuolar protein sorting-associated protein 54